MILAWQNYLGCVACVLCLVYMLRNRIGWIGAALWAYVLISCLSVFLTPIDRYKGPLGIRLDETAGQAFACMVLLPTIIFYLPEKVFKHWRKVLVWSMVPNAISVLIFKMGILNQYSFDTGLMAMVLPISNLWMSALTLVAIYATPSSTPLLVISAIVFAYAMKRRKWLLIITPVAVFGLAYLIHGSQTLSSTGRVEHWKFIFTHWEEYWFGTGMGTYFFLGPMMRNFEGSLFLHMHNDWLQMLFEGGIIGLALMIAFAIKLARLAWNQEKNFYMLAGLAAFMLTYHPFHFFVSAAFCLCLVRSILEGRKYD